MRPLEYSEGEEELDENKHIDSLDEFESKLFEEIFERLDRKLPIEQNPRLHNQCKAFLSHKDLRLVHTLMWVYKSEYSEIDEIERKEIVKSVVSVTEAIFSPLINISDINEHIINCHRASFITLLMVEKSIS